MAFTASCDICGKDVDGPNKIAELLPDFQVASVKHTCQDCVKKVDEKLTKLREFYNKDIANDMREFILNLKNTPKKSRFLTK